MSIGDQIVITETVVVFDALGQDVLVAGTKGTVAGIEGDLLAVQTAKGLFDSVPISCARLRTEENAA